MTKAQINHMVGRFLSWKLPENFHPDAGISFVAAFNEHTAHPMRHEPSGTNLFDAVQAEAMVRHMVEGLPSDHSGDANEMTVSNLRAENAELREALEIAEAAMSIVEPRSDKAKYLDALRDVRKTLSAVGPSPLMALVEAGNRLLGTLRTSSEDCTANGIVQINWPTLAEASDFSEAWREYRKAYTSIIEKEKAT